MVSKQENLALLMHNVLKLPSVIFLTLYGTCMRIKEICIKMQAWRYKKFTSTNCRNFRIHLYNASKIYQVQLWISFLLCQACWYIQEYNYFRKQRLIPDWLENICTCWMLLKILQGNIAQFG